MKLEEIARRLPGDLIGPGDLDVSGLAHPDDAGADDLAVALADDVELGATAARAAVVRSAAAARAGLSLIVHDGEPRAALAVLTAMFDPGPVTAAGVHPTAVIADDAEIGERASIGPYSVVGPGTRIGAGTRLLAHVVVGSGVVIGDDGVIHPGVVIGDGIRIGDRVTIQANAVLGSDGFSFVMSAPGQLPAEGVHPRIRSLGTVIVGDDVDIGVATAVDRGTLRATRIGDGAKIDNQVQIAHNVTVGRSVIIAGQSGIAGSSVIGDAAVLAAKVGVTDHVNIGGGAIMTAMCGVTSAVPKGDVVMGMPAVTRAKWLSRYTDAGRLPRLYRIVKELTERVAALELGPGDKNKSGAADG